jgi:hypothetical protein
VGRAAGPGDRWVWGLSVLAILNVLLYWLVIPYRTQQRFMLHAFGLATMPLARLFARARWIRIASVPLLVIHLISHQSWPFPLGSPPWDLSSKVPNGGFVLIPVFQGFSDSASGLRTILNITVGIASLAAVWAWNRSGTIVSNRARAWAAAPSVALFAVAVLVAYPWGSDSRDRFYPANFANFRNGWRQLDLRVGPSGARVAYAGTDLPYYLLGAGLRNDVRYVNVDGRAHWLMHDYHREAISRGEPLWPNPRPGWDRLQPDYSAWLAALRAERIQILVVTRLDSTEGRFYRADSQGFPIERLWAEQHPDAFEPLYGVTEHDPNFRFYRVLPGPSSRDIP